MLLASRALTVRAVHNNKLISRATVKGHSGLVNHLLDNGANIEAQSKGGQRPVHVAAYLGLVEIAQIFTQPVQINVRGNR